MRVKVEIIIRGDALDGAEGEQLDELFDYAKRRATEKGLGEYVAGLKNCEFEIKVRKLGELDDGVIKSMERRS